MFLLAMTLL